MKQVLLSRRHAEGAVNAPVSADLSEHGKLCQFLGGIQLPAEQAPGQQPSGPCHLSLGTLMPTPDCLQQTRHHQAFQVPETHRLAVVHMVLRHLMLIIHLRPYRDYQCIPVHAKPWILADC